MIEQKLNIILDLDNTLLCAVPLDEVKAYPSIYDYLNRNLKWIDMGSFYRIYLRPHLDDFLDFLFDNYNVSVFTAAERDYAQFVVDKIIKPQYSHRRLDFVFYRYHNMISLQVYNSMKDLRMLWDIYHMYYFYPWNTIIIDDFDLVKKSNPNNCLQIKKFEVNRSTAVKEKVELINDTSLINISKKLFELRNRYEEGDLQTTFFRKEGFPILYRDYEINRIF
jgi:TFIIF-interacting CTD phosphatase-like protein